MAATHKGHCQACGSLQMLPKGRLSLHGYRVLGGYFSGVCRGAKEKPFEVSCDLVERFIREAKAALDAVETEQATLRGKPDGTWAWVHHFVGSRKNASSYEWVRVQLRVEDDAEGRHAYFYTARKDWSLYQPQMVERRITDYDYGRKPVAEFVQALNATRANWMEHEADSLRRYITWQKARVANWKPAPLIPVDAKDDKAGFKPTEAKY
jgi:hypothetical protein